jgi:ketosteroid isomerase-like protein
MTTNLETVQQAYAAFGKRDVAGLLATVDPDVVWENPGPTSPNSFGTHHGHAAVAHDAVHVFRFANAEVVRFQVFQNSYALAKALEA